MSTMRRKEARFLARNNPVDFQVAGAAGDHLFDAAGKRYIDFLTGWCVGNLGWARPEIREAIRGFEGPDYVYPGFSYAPWVELAELLAKVTPGPVEKCFRATGGSEAVELALQAAMIHTGRRKLLSIEDSYHGNTLGVLSIGASEARDTIPNLLQNCHKLASPLDADALSRLETQLRHRDVAAFVMEPVIINLGVLIPEPEFMTGLQELCRRYGTLLVADEVATGFGRTGRLFASELFGLEPDIVCLSKAVTGGGAGLGAMVASAEVGESMEKKGTFYSTYGWHPLSTAVAIASVRYLVRDEKRLMEGVEATSGLFRQRLEGMRFPEPPELRIRGLAMGVDVHDPDYARRVRDRCREGGLILSAEDTTLLLLPRLEVDHAAALEGLEILEACL